MNIEMRNIYKSFGRTRVLNDVSVKVPDGAVVALLGPSGSGKTTALRILSGLDVPDSGTVLFDGKDTTGESARARGVGLVFQHYALFEHMDVFSNIGFALSVRKRPRSEIRSRVEELLHLVQLTGFERHHPSQLSGGQRQRVALARALAAQPQVLLLDEPFGALDTQVRRELRRWLRRLHDELKVTSVIVTHDQEEALEVADEIVVLNHGKVEQAGSPHEVLDRPASAFVAQFFGSPNILHGHVSGGRAAAAEFDFSYPEYPHAQPQTARVFIRPHELDITTQRESDTAISATVVRIIRLGSSVKVELITERGTVVSVELDDQRFARLALVVGDEVWVQPRKVWIFPDVDPSGKRKIPLA